MKVISPSYSTNIRSKTDGDEVSYSGSGQVKIKDQNHNFNFQTSKVHLTKEKNNEVGFEVNINELKCKVIT